MFGFTCVLVSSGVCAVDVVGLVDNWDGVGRDVDGDMLVDRGMVDRDGVGWLVVVDGGGVGGQLLDMVVGAGVLRGGGAGLVGPGVVGEPLGGDEVLAGGVGRVYITPLGPGTVHSHTVALHHSVSVPEGQTAALTATVYQGRGGLGLRVLQLHRAGGRDDGEGGEERGDGQHHHICSGLAVSSWDKLN